MNVGRSIKKIRESKGISGKFVSKRLGIDPSTLSKYESGDREVKAKMLPMIADALGVEVADFFKEEVGEKPISTA